MLQKVPLPLPFAAVLVSLYATPYITPARSADITSNVQKIGNPFLPQKAIYSRNVWDMQVFEGRIHLGHGDSAANTGPTPIVSLDPATNAFSTDFITSDEQVDRFRVIRGELWTAGHDFADGRGKFSNSLYALKSGKWRQFQSNVGFIHGYDLAEYDNKIFLSVGAGGQGAPVAMSNNGDGVNWKDALKIPYTVIPHAPYPRGYDFLTVGGQLYVSAGVSPNTTAGTSAALPWDSVKLPYQFTAVYRWDKPTQKWVDCKTAGLNLLPDRKYDANYRLLRATVLPNNRTLYIGAQNVNDHQWTPVGLYSLSAVNPSTSATKITLPDAESVPYDILTRGQSTFVLGYNPKTKVIYVWEDKSGSAGQLVEKFRFQAATFARSFEEVNGNFYLGLGCASDNQSSETGSILKVAVAAYQPSAPAPAPAPAPKPPAPAPKPPAPAPAPAPRPPAPAPIPSIPVPPIVVVPKPPTPSPAPVPAPAPAPTPAPSSTPPPSSTPAPGSSGCDTEIANLHIVIETLQARLKAAEAEIAALKNGIR